jgi:MarR family transcriptional regulator, organic hydroperoxide resistance regulator
MDNKKKILNIIHIFQDINVFLRNKIHEVANSSHFTLPQLTLLTILLAEDGLRISDLSRNSGLSESTVSGIVDRLVKQKALLRKRNQTDRRVVNIYLTDASREECERFNRFKEEFFIDILSNMNDSELEQAKTGLTMLSEKMKLK